MAIVLFQGFVSTASLKYTQVFLEDRVTRFLYSSFTLRG